MNWIFNLSARGKQMVLSTLFVLVIIVLTVSSLLVVSKLEANLDRVGDDVVGRLNLLLQADRDLYQALVAERSLLFLAADDPNRAKMVEQHQENISQARERMVKFAGMTKVEASIDLYRRYDSLRQQWEQLTQKVVSSSGDEARSLSFGEAASAFSSMRDQIDQLTERMEKEIEIAMADAAATEAASRRQMTLFAAIGTMIALFMAWWLGGIASSTLLTIRDRMAQIAEGEGDLSQRLPV